MILQVFLVSPPLVGSLCTHEHARGIYCEPRQTPRSEAERFPEYEVDKQTDKFYFWGLPFGSRWLNAPSQPNLSAALRNTNPDFATGFPPPLTHNVPVRKVVLGYRDLGLLRLSRFQCHTGEAIECLRRLSGRSWEFQVQLWRLVWKRQQTYSASHQMQMTHLSSSYLSVVLNIESDAVCGTMEPDRPRRPSGVGGRCLTGFPYRLFQEFLQVAKFFDHQIRILERGVAQTEAKLESRSDVFLIR